MDIYCANVFVKNSSGNDIPLPFQTVTHIGVHDDLIADFQKLTSIWLLREPCYNLKARAIFMLILAKCHQLVYFRDYEINSNRSRDKRIDMVIQYILSHYAEPISVNEMSKMTKSVLCILEPCSNRKPGKTFREYLNMIRINQAENLLNSGLFNVSEVAVNCGFSDVFYFSKVFKKHRGIAPSEILKKYVSWNVR